MATLKYIAGVDLMTVTLASGYTAGSGSMSLTEGHGARLPSAGDFWLRTTTGTYRCFKVTARSTDTLTVTAAQDGTSDGNLDAATELKWVLGATAFDQFRGDLVQTGADASKSYEKVGNLYLPNDGFSLYRDTGAAMVPWGPIFPLTAHDDSGFSWDNQDTATVVTTKGGVHISTAANSAAELYARYKAKTGTYKITVCFLPNLWAANYQGFYLGWRQSSDGKIVSAGYQYVDGLKLSVLKWTNSTTYSTTYQTSLAALHGSFHWLQIEVDATNRICRWSRDGQNFQVLHTVAKADYITPDQVLYALQCQNATYGCGATIISWKEE